MVEIGTGSAAIVSGVVIVLVTAGAVVARRSGRLVVDIRDTHLLPVLPQLTLYAYWGAYWPGLRAYMPVVVCQLAVAAALDAYVSWIARRRMVLSAGFLPIVLSLNLIAQFPAERPWSIVLAPVIAVLAKYGPVRDGRHVFNPSAIGITVVGLIFVAMGERAGDVSQAFGAPPSMLELVFVVALLPQLRRPIVLVSFGAWLGNVVAATLGKIVGLGALLNGLWAPILLTHVLLATDPATTPRTGPGRLLFGAFVGAGEVVAAHVLDAILEWDFLGKVVAIPVANLLVPWFDATGARWTARGTRVRRWLAPERNSWHVAAWATLMLGIVVLGHTKAHQFVVQGRHFPLPAARPVDDPARACTENPAFCRPFAIADELRLWTDAPR